MSIPDNFFIRTINGGALLLLKTLLKRIYRMMDISIQVFLIIYIIVVPQPKYRTILCIIFDWYTWYRWRTTITIKSIERYNEDTIAALLLNRSHATPLYVLYETPIDFFVTVMAADFINNTIKKHDVILIPQWYDTPSTHFHWKNLVNRSMRRMENRYLSQNPSMKKVPLVFFPPKCWYTIRAPFEKKPALLLTKKYDATEKIIWYSIDCLFQRHAL